MLCQHLHQTSLFSSLWKVHSEPKLGTLRPRNKSAEEEKRDTRWAAARWRGAELRQGLSGRFTALPAATPLSDTATQPSQRGGKGCPRRGVPPPPPTPGARPPAPLTPRAAPAGALGCLHLLEGSGHQRGLPAAVRSPRQGGPAALGPLRAHGGAGGGQAPTRRPGDRLPRGDAFRPHRGAAQVVSYGRPARGQRPSPAAAGPFGSRRPPSQRASGAPGGRAGALVPFGPAGGQLRPPAGVASVAAARRKGAGRSAAAAKRNVASRGLPRRSPGGPGRRSKLGRRRWRVSWAWRLRGSEAGERAGVGGQAGSQAGIARQILPYVAALGPEREREAQLGESRRAAKIKNSLRRSHVVISRWRRVKYSVWFNIWWKYPKPHAALPPTPFYRPRLLRAYNSSILILLEP